MTSPRRFFLFLAGILLCGVGLRAEPLPVTEFTVVARVDAFEYYRAFGGDHRYSLDTPHGNLSTIVATILYPDSLAGREIAIPFESSKKDQELFVQPGTVFRFEHRLNLSDLRARTDNVRRSAIAFPALGVIVLNAEGEVTELYEGSLTSLAAARLRQRQNEKK